MSGKKIHFMYETRAGKEANAALAQSFIQDLGQASLDEADTIVTVGGDGLLLQALRAAPGKIVYAVTSAACNSNGFWTDHDVETTADLEKRLEGAETIPLMPLRADITFANGAQKTVYGFNDIIISPLSGQAVIANLTAEFQKQAQPSRRIIGDGLIFATAFGSTAASMSYGGPAVDIRQNAIILTGKGTYEPKGGFHPAVMDGGNSVFKIDFISVADKRPVRIDYDGQSIQTDEAGGPVQSLRISADPGKSTRFVVTADPAIRAYSMMMP